MVGMKFVSDNMLGRLSRWLRALGYDVLYPNHSSDSELLRIALSEDRILLTRDKELASKRSVKSVLVRYDRLEDQLLQLKREVGIVLDETKLFSRCMICNTSLEKVPKERAFGKVPEYVYSVHDLFSMCPGCGRFYWRGTQWDAIRRILGALWEERG
jgi:uncharacterized protein with PIN domain